MARRATKTTDALVTLAETMLARRFAKSDVKAAIARRVTAAGETISPRTIETILGRARERIIARTQISKGEHRAFSLASYERVLRSRHATERDRIRAQAQIDKLLGLAEPRAIVIDDGPPMPPPPPTDEELVEREHARRDAFKQAVREAVKRDPRVFDVLRTLGFETVEINRKLNQQAAEDAGPPNAF